MSKKKLAAILPRYAANLGGGAETLVGSLLEAIVNERSPLFADYSVEIWTTCARDHRTWENFYPAGLAEEEGLTVRRFPVDERDLDTFISAELAMVDGKRLSVEQQLDWLAASVNSSALYEHIAREGTSFDHLLFAPYLFATTFWGALIHPERSVLVPCLHNEHYAYQEVFRALMQKVQGLIFNAEAERGLACELFGTAVIEPKSAVVGMGFDPQNLDVQESSDPYVLYVGRKERGKNLDLLIEYMRLFKNYYPDSSLQLVVIGAGEIDFLEENPPWLVDKGFVSTEEKRKLIRGAVSLVQPSTNESYSIVLMESWLQEVPVVVHGECAVTKEHVIDSNGGLYFANAVEFAKIIRELELNEALRTTLGRSGREYVQTRYSWDAVLERFYNALELFESRRGAPQLAVG